MAAAADSLLLSPGNQKKLCHVAQNLSLVSVSDLVSVDALATALSTKDDDTDPKWVVELERELIEMETEPCKIAPTISDSSEETKIVHDKWVLKPERVLMDMEMESCKVAPTIADSSKDTNKVVHDETYAKCAPSSRNI